MRPAGPELEASRAAAAGSEEPGRALAEAASTHAPWRHGIPRASTAIEARARSNPPGPGPIQVMLARWRLSRTAKGPKLASVNVGGALSPLT